MLVFFDDILVYSKDNKQHLDHLEQVLRLMREHKLFAKQSKCVFGGQAVEYLGHIISKEGVSTNPSKVEAITNWLTPKTLIQLRGFLGLGDYCRRFIRYFWVIAKPLTDLLKKDTFGWHKGAQIAFDQLKLALSSAPIF